jgi:hypothetical protein
VADVQIKVPASLGLSDEQLQQLGDKLLDHLVETLEGTRAEEIVAARAKASGIVKSQVVRKTSRVDA